MKQEQYDEIENILNTLSLMEIDYLRNWLMDIYPIYEMDHDVDTIIMIMEDFDVKYNDVKKILDNIKDQKKWVLDVSYFIENEKKGYYRVIEAQQIIDHLSEKDFDKYLNYLKEKYPIYKEEKYSDYILINNSFGNDNHPKWDEIYNIVKNELYKK